MVQWSKDGVGELGWSWGVRMVQVCKDDAVVKVLGCHQCGPGSIPGMNAIMICWLNLLLVVFFVARGFSAGTPVFPALQTLNFYIPIGLSSLVNPSLQLL